MVIFKKINNALHYWMDNFSAQYHRTVIEKFTFDKNISQIMVLYRIGNKKLVSQESILNFENRYFDSCSHHDRNRLTKFSTLQNVLNYTQSIFTEHTNALISFIINEITHEYLF